MSTETCNTRHGDSDSVESYKDIYDIIYNKNGYITNSIHAFKHTRRYMLLLDGSIKLCLHHYFLYLVYFN